MGVPRIAFLPAHPAQFWLMRPIADAVRAFAEPVWVLRDKDCLLDLAHAAGVAFTVLSPARRGLVRNAATLAADVLRAARLQRTLGIDAWLTKYGAACIAARLTGRASIAFNDDDADVVPLIAAAAYPFASAVLAPSVTRMGRYDHKTRRFRGNFELFYLHPDRFTPCAERLRAAGVDADHPYLLVRLSALTAHHDVGARGVSERMLQRLIELAAGRVRIYISSEKPLAPALEPLRLPIPVERMHDALAFARVVIGDSQTMASEAAVLGTPSIRISSFVGRLSYLADLEARGMSFGFLPGDEANALACVRRILDDPAAREAVRARRRAFLEEVGDPLPWFVEQMRSIICPA